jgi:tetratricopeptide (TPR) repeat protein
MATKDPKELKTAKEKIAEQKKMKDDLTGALLAGRLAAKTETKVKVPAAEIDKAAPKAKAASIPAPKKAAPPAAKPAAKPPAHKPTQSLKPAGVKAPASKKSSAKRVAWDPKRLMKFVAGVITLGELEGITKDQQYEMAKLGHRFIRQGKLAEAKTIFEGLVALDPHDAYFHLALGSIAQRNDDLEEAEERYSRALEINPFSPHALSNRGEVRMMRGRMLEGAKDLMRAIEEDPEAKQEATKRAKATITVVMEQLESTKPPAPKPGPTKKAGIPGPAAAPRSAKPQPRPRPRPAPKK